MDAITVITLVGRIIAGLASLLAEYALYRQRQQESEYARDGQRQQEHAEGVAASRRTFPT